MFRDQYNPKDDPDVHALIKSEVDDYIVNYVGVGEVYRPTHSIGGSGRKARIDWVSPYKGTAGHYVITAELHLDTRAQALTKAYKYALKWAKEWPGMEIEIADRYKEFSGRTPHFIRAKIQYSEVKLCEYQDFEYETAEGE